MDCVSGWGLDDILPFIIAGVIPDVLTCLVGEMFDSCLIGEVFDSAPPLLYILFLVNFPMVSLNYIIYTLIFIGDGQYEYPNKIKRT
jgi:hypothetical protein